MPKDRDPRALLPLTPLAFQVLLAISDRPLHGYGIIQEVELRTDGVIELRTGSLYMLLPRFLDQGLIEESSKRPRPDEDDPRRRYYGLTDFGRAVVVAEARRLQAVLGEVRRKQVLRPARKATR